MDAIETGGSLQGTPTHRRLYRSFFTKKLERKFLEKELDVPQQVLSLMDVPFEEFTPQDREIYETRIKPFSYVFVEHLTEVYEVMGRPRSGWEEMMGYIEPSPIKVLASLVIHEEEKIKEMEADPDPLDVTPIVSAPTEKIKVRTYTNTGERNPGKERRWGKKLF